MKNFKTNNTLALLFLLSLCVTLNAQDNGDKLFDNSFLHEIRFEWTTNSDLWDTLSTSYVMVKMTIDGLVIDSVGLRIKGFTSTASPQKPLKIDLNEYISKQVYDGMEKFNLHNNYMDATLQRDGLAYELYRRAGLPSPRTAYAEVYVEGEFRGVYSISEQIDKDFLKHNFPSSKGSLYKGGFGFAGLSIELKEQLNQGFARNPNGTGDFVIQEPTFNSNNSRVVSIEELPEIDFVAYPNPASNFISIKSNELVKRILFSAITGREIQRIENPQFPLNLSSLNAGMYFMRLDFEAESYTVKIIKK